MSTVINKSLILNNIKSHYNFNSDSDFAKFLGIKPQTLSSWHARNTFDIELLYAKCENINADFLLTGKGDVEKTKSKENATKIIGGKNGGKNGGEPKVEKMPPNEPEEERVYPLYSEQEYRAVMRKIKFAEGVSLADEGAPFYPLPVSAGNAMQLLEEEEKPTGFLSIPGVYCKAYFPVIGFSFEPIIRAGDVIGIDFINRWEMLDPDCIYFIITHDQRMIKRLSDDPDNPDRLICISPNHKEFPIYKSEIKAIHKVIFYGRLV